MNIHRTSTEGCEEFIQHFSKNCQKKSFSIQIIELLEGNGYTENGEIDEESRKSRLEREDYWMKALRSVFPYGLNDRVKLKGQTTNGNIGKLFPPLSRYGERPPKKRENVA